MSRKTPAPHDSFVKSILGREKIARDFIRYYLPEEINADLDLDTLEVSSKSFVSDEFRESLTDIIMTLQLENGDPAEIYILIEHKSDLYKLTKLQLLNYLNAIWQKERKEDLPLIIPVVFYHGKKKWKYSLEFSDMFSPPSEHYLKYIPRFEHILHEVPEINRQKVKSNIVLEIFHLLLENVFNPEKREEIYSSFELLHQGLNAEEAGEIFGVMVKYLLSATDVSPEEVEEKVKHLPKGVDTVRTTADILREEGEINGLKKGVILGEKKRSQDMLIKALKLKFDFVKPQVAEQIKGIQSLEVLDNLFELTYKCSTIEDFFLYLNQASEK